MERKIKRLINKLGEGLFILIAAAFFISSIVVVFLDFYQHVSHLIATLAYWGILLSGAMVWRIFEKRHERRSNRKIVK